MASPDSKHFDYRDITWPPLLAAVGFVALLLLVFNEGVAHIVHKWDAKAYNHGYLIPVVALYLFWLRAREFGRQSFRGSWTGVAIVALAIGFLILGELSTITSIIDYAFMLALFGLLISGIGWSGFKLVWVPCVYLLFMIPLPEFLYNRLSAELQLISSEIGVAVIRIFSISVFLEGNVIDLGNYQLQVAEACSGLRYLFPLMSFGFLCAALYRGPWWHRTIIFLSSIPITVLMNSFRIGVIGVLVENYGIEQAEGFLHYFEGWIIFIACVGILFLEMWALNKLNPGNRQLLEVFGLDIPPATDLVESLPKKVKPPMVATSVILICALGLTATLANRPALIPERERLTAFPLVIEEWRGRDAPVAKIYLDFLNVDDHLMARYHRPDDRAPVELWIAYYESQTKGQSTHSPRTCLPGGGWQIETLEQRQLADIGPSGESLTVNRAVISKQNFRQVVYYWFVERGRPMTDEYMVKWQIFWDALTKGRTDGALVRVSTMVSDVAALSEGDARLESFVRALDAPLAYYLPRETAVFRAAGREPIPTY